MDNIREILAANIKRLRKAKGWNQNDLAVESGVSFRGIQNIETGSSFPRTETLAAIAGALGVTENALFTGSTLSTLGGEPVSDATMDKIRLATKQAVAEQLADMKPKLTETNKIEDFQTKQERELIAVFRGLPKELKDHYLGLMKVHVGRAASKRLSKAKRS